MAKISTFSLANTHHILVNPSVLYVEDSSGGKNPIAIRLTINPKSKLAFWENTTSRGHSINIKEYTITEKKIVIISSDDTEWTFVPLTLEKFNKIKKDLISIDQEFESDDDLQIFYSEANFNV
jgi:hypothetical protein